jgi:hypothetical protein
VDHSAVLTGYREAHELTTRSPDVQTTEDLRRAVLGYRRLFEDVVGTPAETAAAVPDNGVDLRARARHRLRRRLA